MIITSASNDRIKEIKKIIKSAGERKKRGIYPVEGIRMFREIPPQDMDSIFVSESCADKYKDAIGRYENVEPVIVADHVFHSMSDTNTPQGIMAFVRMKQHVMEELFDRTDTAPFILIIEKLQDPGNLGTIIRTAEAAGVTGIIVSDDSADVYNPKTIRSTMGAVFRMNIVISDDLKRDIDILKGRGITIYGAHLKGDVLYHQSLTEPCAFLIGNEGNGLSEEISATADRLLRIPMQGEVESLNAAISSAVIAYEVLRQRNY